MNWETRKSVLNRLDGDDACEHVEANPELAVTILREMDTFGPVAGLVVCRKCLDAIEKAKQEEMVICFDCGNEVMDKDTINWTAYDHYPPQGDEPLTICHGCVNKSTHVNRQRRDDEMREREDEYY